MPIAEHRQLWPEEKEIDEFIGWLHQCRRKGRYNWCLQWLWIPMSFPICSRKTPAPACIGNIFEGAIS